MLAKIEVRRTNEIAHILDEEDIDGRKIERMQRVVHHVSVEVASLSRGDLYGRNALGANALRVVFGFEVAFDNGDAKNLSPTASMVASSRLVLPDPGEDIRLTARMPRRSRCSRLCAASWSFSCSMFLRTSTDAPSEGCSEMGPFFPVTRITPGVTEHPHSSHIG